MYSWTATGTASQSTEAHAGAEIHGTPAERGYSKEDIDAIQQRVIEMHDMSIEVHNLHEMGEGFPEAYLLVIDNFLNPKQHAELCEEVQSEVVEKDLLDKFAPMRGTLKNKRARWTTEYGPDEVKSTFCKYKPGDKIPPGEVLSGGVLPFVKHPKMHNVVKLLERVLDRQGLRMEMNYYYDKKKCYIGFHGDGERKDVAGVIMGAPKDLHFQGFRKAEPVGNMLTVTLNSGSLYVMSEKATGNDWIQARARKDVIHYRHAAGGKGVHNANVPSLEMIKKKRKRKLEKRAMKKQKI